MLLETKLSVLKLNCLGVSDLVTIVVNVSIGIIKLEDGFIFTLYLYTRLSRRYLLYLTLFISIMVGGPHCPCMWAGIYSALAIIV